MLPFKAARACCYWFIYSFLFTISLLPYSVLNFTIGKFLYLLTFKILKYRYAVVLQNLSRSFPNKSYTEIRQIAVDFYVHLSSLLVEMIKLFSISKQQLLKRVNIANPELLNYYYQQNKDIIVMLGHYGNWEYLNILPQKTCYQVNAIYKPLSTALMDKMIYRLRARFGMHLIPAHQAVRTLLKEKEKPNLSLFIADQFPGGEAKCKIDFMQQRAAIFTGPEKLAKATDSTVLYLEILPDGLNQWTLHFSLIAEQAKQTEEYEITGSFIRKLQQSIYENPGIWLWSHRRWKEVQGANSPRLNVETLHYA